MAVIFLDIDHFKMINDQLGHRGGDDVLAEFAKRLKHCVRETDTVARLAGDEFVIVLEGLHAADEPKLVAEKIIDAMEREFVTSGTSRKVTTSIGIALRRGTETDPAALLHRADEALYRAKAAGRNTFRVSSA
jgi:diguanylate cyclase (GGDEF)-like protein